MRYASFLKALLIQGHPRKSVRAFTLVELLITVAIVATLGTIGVPMYTGYMDRGRCSTAAVDIREMDQRIATFEAENGRLPNTLAEAGFANPIDPWGNQYQYLVIWGVDPEPPGTRKDHFVHPLNNDYDLYSMGKDGDSVAPLTGGPSHDDIIRANNGRFIGLATDY